MAVRNDGEDDGEEVKVMVTMTVTVKDDGACELDVECDPDGVAPKLHHRLAQLRHTVSCKGHVHGCRR